MNRVRSLFLGVAVAALAAAAASGGACTGDGDSQATGGGAAAASAGAGGQSTTTISTTTTTTGGGAGGEAGAGGAPSFGEAPVWAVLPEPIATCAVEQLQNPSAVRAFYWETCGAGCRSAVFRPGWPLTDVAHGATFETAQGVFVGMTLSLDPPEARWMGIVAREDGFVAQAFRTAARTLGDCQILLPSTAAGRYAFAMLSTAGQNHLGAGFGPLDGSAPTFVRDFTPAPVGIGPQIYSVFGPERWLWYYYVDKLLSVSSLDGSDLTVIAQSQSGGPILAVDGPKWTGDQILFEQVNTVGNTVQGVIARSDGVSPTETYLAPSDDSYFGQPEYAHSRLGWVRGHLGRLVSLP